MNTSKKAVLTNIRGVISTIKNIKGSRLWFDKISGHKEGDMSLRFLLYEKLLMVDLGILEREMITFEPEKTHNY